MAGAWGGKAVAAVVVAVLARSLVEAVSPTPTPTPTTTATVACDALIVTKPSASDGPYHVGSTIAIQWTSGACVASFVDLELCSYVSGGTRACYSTDSGVISVSKYHKNDGSENVIIVNAPPAGAGYYSIKVIDDTNTSRFNYSEYFEFQASAYSMTVPASSVNYSSGLSGTACSNITVTKPSLADGPFSTGDTIEVEWSPSGCFPDFVELELCVYTASTTLQCYVKGSGVTSSSQRLNDGSDSIAVLSNPPAGSGYYRVKIIDDNNSSRFVLSDYFRLTTTAAASAAAEESCTDSVTVGVIIGALAGFLLGVLATVTVVWHRGREPQEPRAQKPSKNGQHGQVVKVVPERDHPPPVVDVLRAPPRNKQFM